ncbi:MAG: LysM peptidoglycan-binding domain-containing protein, partial [Desulfuromonadaceae bacterium]|nr:LysM peptidoglycan-binding domain-containing protein [Desulfuromonadaceae bacterium]
MAHIRILVIFCLILLALPQLSLASKSHLVRKNESLQFIARKYHVSVDELKQVNNLTSSRISKGTRLIIPSHPAAHTKKTAQTHPATYKVVRGDSLFRIARKTGVKVADIKALNGLSGKNKLQPGKVLILAAAETIEPPAENDRLQLINKDLLNEDELAETLAELTDIQPDKPVD